MTIDEAIKVIDKETCPDYERATCEECYAQINGCIKGEAYGIVLGLAKWYASQNLIRRSDAINILKAQRFRFQDYHIKELLSGELERLPKAEPTKEEYNIVLEQK